MGYHDREKEGVLADLSVTEDGLTKGQAEERLEKYGPNELTQGKEISRLKIFFEQFNSSIVFVLIIATLITAFLGEWKDSIAIFIILILNAVLGYVQEYKAEEAIESLKELSAPKASVMRNGKIVNVDSKKVVPGDVMLLKAGDKIPADARVLKSHSLETQEAALTGESTSVKKISKKLSSDLQLGDMRNMTFSGTVVTKGKGKAVVTATGMKTEVGKIAGMIQGAETEETPLQKKLDSLAGKLGILTLVISAIVFATGLLRGQEMLPMFMVAVSLAVAAIPEGLPAVITISLAFGVNRMLEKNALVRRLPSVETLGSTTVICTDKTGTLTHNQMTVEKVYVDGEVVEVTGKGYSPDGEVKGHVDPLIFRIGALCNDSELDEDSWTVVGDPTEGCLLTSAMKAGLDQKNLRKSSPRHGGVPFDSERKRMTTIHDHDDHLVAYTKGAPDILLDLCNRKLVNGKVTKLTKKDRKKILEANESFTTDALRVLGFAYKEDIEDKEEYDKDIEKDMIFVGLQAMMDPPREEVKEAIEKCKTAGIRVIMVTGDHKHTATAIAKELGIEGRAVEGKDIEDIDLEKDIDDIGVFARVSPEHKLDIVGVLKDKGEITAMTGDGVNDAPALKDADIGIAMGIAGTDVAKEASEMVLTDDNFASIVHAVEEGRGIFDNIKKFVNYLLSSNFGEVLVLFVAMLIGFSGDGGGLVVPLITIQILWMNLVTDSLPALALGVDPAESGIMKRKPRDPDINIINKNMSWNIFVIGILICVSTLYLFQHALPDPDYARTMALTTLVIMEIVRLQMIRQGYHVSIGENKYLIWSVLGVLALQVIAIYTPLNNWLDLVPIGFMDWVHIAMVCAFMMIVGLISSHFIKEWTHQRD